MKYSKQLFQFYLPLLIIVFIGLFNNYKYFGHYPVSEHSWAQTDYFAISQGFLRNNLDFWHPESYIMNHQFPDNWQVAHKTSITPANFPIHSYIPAVLMKILNSNSFLIFRIYSFLWSIIGLFFLFKIALQITKNHKIAYFVLIFGATSNVFMFFQISFLPSIPSLSTALIGLFLYTKYCETGKFIHLISGLLFLLLTVLTRMTFAIVLVPILFIEYRKALRGYLEWGKIVLPSAILFTLFTINYKYEYYLREMYGSLFVGAINPAQSFQDFINLIWPTLRNNIFMFLSVTHWTILILIIGFGLIILANNKKHYQFWRDDYIILCILLLSASVAFYIAMQRHFVEHSYYFLDAFFISTIFTLIVVLDRLKVILFKNKRIAVPVYSISIALLFLNSFIFNKNRHEVKSEKSGLLLLQAYKDTDKTLDSLGISRDAKILVIDSYIPQLPFVLMKRKGYITLYLDPWVIQGNLTHFPYDYFIYRENIVGEKLREIEPIFAQNIKKLFSNGKITVCKYGDFTRAISDDQIKTVLDFEEPRVFGWRNLYQNQDSVYDGKYSSKLNIELYGPTFEQYDVHEILQSPTKIQIKLAARSKVNFSIVVSVTANEEIVLYKSIPIGASHSWKEHTFQVSLPALKEQNSSKFSTYIYNHEKGEVSVDNIELEMIME